MYKDKIKRMLINMMSSENITIIESLLELLDGLSEEELHTKFKNINITEEFLKKIIEDFKKNEEHTNDFIPVNEWFCYGRTGNTIHLHLIPKDLRGVKTELGDEAFYQRFKDLLEDFLAKMQIIFLDDETAKSLFAVSPIFYNSAITLAFESLGFDKLTEIDPDNKNDYMSLEQKEHFMNMFNKYGIYSKKVYYTKMTREKLLGTNYSKIAEEHTNKLS